MRKIEKLMLDSLDAEGTFFMGNTTVTYDDVIDGREAEVRLHGHLIAKRLKDGNWMINLQGWNTVTTRSRLSAILRHYYPGILGVGTKKGQAYIAYRSTGNRNIGDYEWVSV